MSAAARNGPKKTPFLRTSNVLWDEIDLTSVDEMTIPEYELPDKLLRRGDLLVCEGGEIGRAAIWNGEFETIAFQNHIHRLRPRVPNVMPRFYVYFLQSAFTQLGIFEGVGNKTTIPNLSRGRLTTLHVPQPTIDEQQAIVNTLSRVRRAIKLQNRIAMVVQELKQAVTSTTLRIGLRNESIKETTIGPMPRSWEPKSVLDLCGILSGGTPRKSVAHYWDGDIPWVSGIELKSSVIKETRFRITWEGVEAGSRVAPAGSVMLLVRGMGLANDLPVAVIKRQMAFNQDVKALVPRGTYSGDFIRAAIYAGKERLLSQVVPSAHGTLTMQLRDIATLCIPCPSDPQEADEIVSIVDTIQRKSDVHQQLVGTLQVLFESLLYRLMTRDLAASEIEL